MKNIAEMNATQLKALLETRQISSVEVMRAILAEIQAKEDSIRSYVTIQDSKVLLNQAEQIDKRRIGGDRVGTLAGLPVAVKDNICTRDLPTTCSSKMLAQFTPPYDATVITRIRENDGIIIGKTNMDEFAMGSSTENSAVYPTRNPRRLDCVPGGTSGGSAAAVAANETMLALGSDTGGSVRQPAAFCGVVGVKPTYGRVSRYGLIAYGSSLDQVGPLAKTVADAKLIYDVIAGHDDLDSTSIRMSVADAPQNIPNPLRIGIPQEYFGPGLSGEVRKAVENVLKRLEFAGHRLLPIRLPHTEYAVPTYYIIACAEASANLARYDGVRYGHRAKDPNDLMDLYKRTRAEGFGAEVKRRIILGTYVLSSGYYDAFYLKAQKVRTLIRQDFQNAFEECDVIIHPVAPTVAYKLKEKIDDPLAQYLGDVYSVNANLAGLPAISVPCGTSGDGLPIGVQVTSAPLTENMLFAVGELIERLA